MIPRKRDDEDEGSSSQDGANVTQYVTENRTFSGSPPGSTDPDIFSLQKKAAHQCQRVIVSDKVSARGFSK